MGVGGQRGMKKEVERDEAHVFTGVTNKHVAGLGQCCHKGLLGPRTPFQAVFSHSSVRFPLHRSQHARQNISMQPVFDGPGENKLEQ